jgi:hypothetical protein
VTLPPTDREQRVADLGKSEQRVLACIDCLSEGINLQANATAPFTTSSAPRPALIRFGMPTTKT